MRVQPKREEAEHQRLEVEHQEAADDVGIADTATQQQSRRLERAARQDDETRADLALIERAVEIADASCLTSGAVEEDLAGVRLRADLAPACP